MKTKRKLTDMRDAELLRDYRAALAETMKTGGEINRRDIIRQVLLTGHPRYYISFDLAYNVIAHIHTNGVTGRKLTLKQQMWLEIYDKVMEEQRRHADLPIHAVLARVLATGRASRYFISESYAYRYIYDVLRESRRRAANRLRA